MNLILKNVHIVSQDLDEITNIQIEDGIIIDISKDIQGEGFDLTGKIVTPGLVEMHCHLREPGYEYKETIETGIESAINGGYTAICPMANTNPVVDEVDTLEYTILKAQIANPNIGFYPIAATTKGLNGEELNDLMELKNAGAIAFSDDGKPLKNLKLLKEALLTGELIISHAEDSSLLTDPLSEAVCIARELEILKEVGGRIHFAHISTKRALELIKNAKKEGLNVTCETAPHYFTFTSEDSTKDGRFKMNPPLRTKEDLNAVIEALKDRTIDCIATDHAPHSIEEKLKAFAEAPFGIVGFETALGASLKLVQAKHLTMQELVEKLSTNPARILNLKDQGQIKIGQIANLTIIDPNLEYVVKAEEFKSKCKISPFNGMTLKGKSIAVIANGKLIETYTSP